MRTHARKAGKSSKFHCPSPFLRELEVSEQRPRATDAESAPVSFLTANLRPLVFPGLS